MKAGDKLRNWCWVNDLSFWEITETGQFKLSLNSGNLDLDERDLDLPHVSAFLGFDFLNQLHGVMCLCRGYLLSLSLLLKSPDLLMFFFKYDGVFFF